VKGSGLGIVQFALIEFAWRACGKLRKPSVRPIFELTTVLPVAETQIAFVHCNFSVDV
jgi:hypothetical protein